MSKKELNALFSTNAGSADPAEKTLDAAAADWLQSTARTCKISTCMNYTRIYQTRISPLIGKKKLQDIRQEDILKIIFENPVLHGEKPSPDFAHVTSWELIRILESAGMEKKAEELTRGLALPSRKRKKIITFSPSEQRKLTTYLLQDLDISKLGILFGLLTGCRLGEICALRTSEIFLDNENVHIARTVQRIKVPENYQEEYGLAGAGRRKTMLIVTDPKTETSDRYVPLHAELLKLLKTNMPKTKYLLNGDKVMDPRTYEYRFRRYQEAAGITPRKFHVLRHTFATNCVAGGMSPKVLSEILGHANVTTTLSLYVHPTMDIKKKQLDDALDTVHIF